MLEYVDWSLAPLPTMLFASEGYPLIANHVFSHREQHDQFMPLFHPNKVFPLTAHQISLWFHHPCAISEKRTLCAIPIIPYDPLP